MSACTKQYMSTETAHTQTHKARFWFQTKKNNYKINVGQQIKKYKKKNKVGGKKGF